MTTETLSTFQALPATAKVRIVPIEGGLTRDEATPLLALVSEMAAQWVEKGAARNAAVELTGNLGGRFYFLAVAYEPSGGDLSGCTKDGLTHALLHYETQLGRRMLNAPRLAVEQDGAVVFLNNLEFKNRRAEGRIIDSTRVFDHLIEDLEPLRAGRFATTVADSWYDRVGKPRG
ncbi:MAG: hypothetical protein RLY93_14540 [Sumerlaeia bacterium]